MNLTTLQELNEEISSALYKMCESEGAKDEPILDGPVDIETYLQTTPKVLWVLKEPYDLGTEVTGGGGWSVADMMREGVKSNRGSHAIMAYATYSIFNGYPAYSDMPYVKDSEEVSKSLRRIACINVKKMPGYQSGSETHVIAEHYQRNRHILLRQIEGLSPNIFIFGSTFEFFREDLDLGAETLIESGSCSYLTKNGILFIHAYHPSQRTVKWEDYIRDIVEVVRQFNEGNLPGSK